MTGLRGLDEAVTKHDLTSREALRSAEESSRLRVGSIETIVSPAASDAKRYRSPYQLRRLHVVIHRMARKTNTNSRLHRGEVWWLSLCVALLTVSDITFPAVIFWIVTGQLLSIALPAELLLRPPRSLLCHANI